MTQKSSSATSQRNASRHLRAILVWRMLFMVLVCVAQPSLAVVCPFVTYMPNGKYSVGYATEWLSPPQTTTAQLIQWWYPADQVEDSVAAWHVYADYLGDGMRSRPPLPDEQDTELNARFWAFVKEAKARGAPSVRFDHLIAATMLAARESIPRSGNWPVIWLDGDPSFGDQLASHGFIVVSSPALYGAAPTPEQRLRAGRAALDATRIKFQSRLRQLGFIGFGEGAVLAAQLAGHYPQASALALIGDWAPIEVKQSRKQGQWIDAAEIYAKTFYATAGESVPSPLQQHPLQAPFSATTRVHFSDIDDAHLQFGLPESCAPKHVGLRAVNSLMLTLTQRELRLRMAQFFGQAFDVALEPEELKLLPIQEQRRQPVQIKEEQLSAVFAPPPDPLATASLLREGGVEALLRSVPENVRPLLATSWWETALAQLHATGDLSQLPTLVDAWRQSQPNSAVAATHFASLGGTDSDRKKLWKQARKLLKSDVRISPLKQQELSAAIDSALAKL